MRTTVAVSLAPEELSDLDQLRRAQGMSRTEVVRDALRWYVRWGERLPLEDPTSGEID